MFLDPEGTITGVGLYPMPGNSFIVDGIVVRNGEIGKKSITFDVKVLPSLEQSQKDLDTLIVYTDKSGKKSGYEFPVTLSQ
jgi:hypothetical protein